MWAWWTHTDEGAPLSTNLGYITYHHRTRWPIVFLEQALILLIGGGLLTFLVRRERRRKAAA